MGVSILTTKCVNDPYETAEVLVRAEAARNGLDFKKCEGREISAVEYYVLRVHTRIDLA